MNTRRTILIALVAMAVIVVGVVVILVAFIFGPGGPKVKVAGCLTSETVPPSFAKGHIYKDNGLPDIWHYTQRVAGDAPYVGDYKAAFRVTHTSPKTMQLAPYEQQKKVDPVVYVDRGQACGDIYVRIHNGLFEFAVYTRTK